MLRAFYEYGQRHPDVILPVGYAGRRIHFIVALDVSGKFVGVEKPDKLTVFCPTKVITGASVQCNPLAEKASIVLSIREEATTDKQLKQNALLDKKHDTFRAWLEDGVGVIPDFQKVLDVLSDTDVMQLICDECVQLKIKPGDCVTFSIDGTLLSDLPGVKAWWKYHVESGVSDSEQMLDVVTGDVVTPQRLMKKVKGLALTGGMAQCSLVSFDKSAFCSYGLEQNYNAPMGSDTADVCIDVLNHLIESPLSVLVGGVKFLHWYDTDLSVDEEDPFAAFFQAMSFESDMSDTDIDTDNGQERAAEIAATRLLMSPLQGTPPVSVLDNQYHIVMIQGDSGRALIRRYETGSYETLYRNVKQWFDDMLLFNINCSGYAKYYGVGALLHALLTDAENVKTEGKWNGVRQVFQGLVQSCLHGGRVPATAAVRALVNIRSSVVLGNEPHVRLYQLLKLWVLREERSKNKEVTLMPGLNEQHPSVAYHLGRLLAAYSELQMVVKPSIGASMLQRYYAGMSQNPTLALPQLQRMSNVYMESLKSYDMRQLFAGVMDSASQGVGDVIPKSLTMEEQAYFALGYRQQVADINRRKTERKSNESLSERDVSDDIIKEDV